MAWDMREGSPQRELVCRNAGLGTDTVIDHHKECASTKRKPGSQRKDSSAFRIILSSRLLRSELLRAGFDPPRDPDHPPRIPS
jgi:hypothetical protein